MTSQVTPLKTFRTTLVSSIFRQFGSCFWYCRIHNIRTLSLKIKI